MPAQRARARRLFASALETPGGLKVQTIHAFCTRLLHQFPFEANVAARFTVLDEASTTQLLDQLTLQVLLEASAEPDSALGQALATAIVVAADQTFKDVIGDAIRERDALVGLDRARRQRRQGHRASCRPVSALTLATRSNRWSRNSSPSRSIPAAEWPMLIEMLDSGSANDKKHIAASKLPRTASGRERIDNYLKVFCTDRP